MSPVAASSTPARHFTLCQRVRYDYSQPVTSLCQRLRIVPPSSHGAQLRREGWHLSVAGVASNQRHTHIDDFGNLTVDVAVSHVDSSVEFVLDVDVDIYNSGTSFDTPADRRYLEHTRLTAADPLTDELANGFGDVASLCARVHDSIGYRWGFTGIHTPAAEALAGGWGVCQDYAHIMLSACRSAGLPARYVSGHMVGEGGSHAWVEVLQPDERHGTWVAEGWDPTHNRRTGPDYLVVAVGRDYADAAPLSGTYVGTATNTLSVRKRLDVG